jgi:drug/metabolite transporter (DMT)-like permease
MNDAYIFFVIVSEFMLGAYSLLIKSVKTTLSTQIVARMATYTVGSFVLGTYFQRLPSISLSHLLSMGLLNTTHIASSYYAFKELPTHVSLSLFYLYPIFNIIFSSLFLNEKYHFLCFNNKIKKNFSIKRINSTKKKKLKPWTWL